MFMRALHTLLFVILNGKSFLCLLLEIICYSSYLSLVYQFVHFSKNVARLSKDGIDGIIPSTSRATNRWLNIVLNLIVYLGIRNIDMHPIFNLGIVNLILILPPYL